MLAKAHCHWHTVTFVQETWGRGGTHWDHQLCSTQSDAGAPYGSAHLPAERPIGACSLWRTFRVQVGPFICAPASARSLWASKMTGASSLRNSRHEWESSVYVHILIPR